MIKTYLRLLRVKHYMKNALVLAPAVFNHSLTDMTKLVPALWGVLVFCLASSAVYIFNDIQDAPKDRLHPRKRLRPIASGEVGSGAACGTAVLLLAMAAGVQYLTGNWAGIAFPALYILLNIAYSMGLKDRPIIDVVILLSGFLLRVVYGAFITDIEISGWLYLTVITGAFYLGLGKRRNELQQNRESGETRRVLRYYTYAFLDKNMYVFLALTNAFYALWALGIPNRYMLWTVPVVMVIFMRYSLDIEGESDGDPVEVVMQDKSLMLLILLFAVMILTILYAL